MNISQVAAQLYTVREHCKTPAEIASSLKKIRAIGYKAVQVNGTGPIADRELMAMLRGQGLVCCALHELSETILTSPERVIERLGNLDCKVVAYPSPGGRKLDTPADLADLASHLNRAGEILYRAGMTLCYHNHHIEFRRVGGRTILEQIFDQTDPRYLHAELDTYWVQYGGSSPEAWCRRLAGRLPILHMKDYIITEKNQPTFAEIGSGNLDWNSIVDAAESSGCQWFCVEQDTCPGDPLDSLAISFQYIKQKL